MLFILPLLLLVGNTIAFVIRPQISRSTSLFGIAEWRDSCCASSGGNADAVLQKPICLLPFDHHEALVQGQTKELRLYEDRFLQLFRRVMDQHEGVLGMGLISEEDEGILSAVPLCEIVDYTPPDKDLGIFLTIQCVGRAELKDIQQMEPYLLGTCVEIVDQGTPNLPLAHVVAKSIEKLVSKLSRQEEELSIQLEAQVKNGSLPDSIEIRNESDDFSPRCDDDDDDDEEDDEDDSNDNVELTRLQRYQQAHEEALASDSQGYCVSIKDDRLRSPQDLTAVSWAAFCTEAVNELDAPYRLQALDTPDLVERLKLGLYLLNEKCKLVEDMLQRNKGRSDFGEEGFA